MFVHEGLAARESRAFREVFINQLLVAPFIVFIDADFIADHPRRLANSGSHGPSRSPWGPLVDPKFLWLLGLGDLRVPSTANWFSAPLGLCWCRARPYC